ncbi:hypothetical protein [Citrobacter werkmanii]|uniref:hypothetical protein n=1 Tax=Citrobacter werkmanii TaxID=67827 RepID=UPI002F33C234
MNTKSGSSDAENAVVTLGFTAEAIYFVFQPLIKEGVQLNFEGENYDESIKLKEYPLLNVDGCNYGVEALQPADHKTYWYYFDKEGPKFLQADDLRQATYITFNPLED